MTLEMIKFKMWNGAWNKLQLKVCQVADASMAHLDKHLTLDLVMISVVCSIPTGGNLLLKYFKPLGVNLGLKCKCDFIMKNSIVLTINSDKPWHS